MLLHFSFVLPFGDPIAFLSLNLFCMQGKFCLSRPGVVLTLISTQKTDERGEKINMISLLLPIYCALFYLFTLSLGKCISLKQKYTDIDEASVCDITDAGADLGGGCRGCAPPLR